MPTSTELRIIEAAGAELDSEALARVPIMCLLRAAVRFVGCGPTDPDCQQRFFDEVLECFGAGGGGGES